MLLAQGIDIKRAILAFWVGYAGAELVAASTLRHAILILASGKIAVDETVVPVLDPGRGRTKKDTSGPLPVTTGPGVEPIPPLSSTATLRVAAPCTP